MRIPGIPYVQGRNSYPDGDGRKFGIAIHNTSNDASDSGEASYATRRTDGVSSHFYVDSDSVTQSLDTDARAGHAGSRNGNENALAVEITGANGWTRQQWLDRVAWDRLAQVLAVLCRHYGITPRRATVAEMTADPRVRAFYGHDDMRRAWGGTTHTDPGPHFPWDHLLACVQRAMSGEEEHPLSALTDKEQRELLTLARDIKKITNVAGYRTMGVATGKTTINNQMGNKAEPVWLVDQVNRIRLTIEAVLSKTATDDGDLEVILRHVDQLAASLTPPSAEQIAEATVRRLGEDDPADAAQSLVAVLGSERAALLGAALTRLTFAPQE